jgi:hypothetical protein
MPCAVLGLYVWQFGMRLSDAEGRLLFAGMMAIVPGLFVYPFSGASAALFLAPARFYDSPVGVKWLELIGSKRLLTVRLVCALFVLAGLATNAVVILFLVGMAPMDHNG